MSQAEDFLALTNFDGKNFPTEFVDREDLLKIGAVGNGSSLFTRGNLFNRFEFEIVRRYNSPSGAIEKVSIIGFKEKKNDFKQTIPTEIKRELSKNICLILGTSNPEIDHKNGRKIKTGTQLEDFQPLSKAANDAKRQHCINCKKTNKRFDAKNLGFNVSYIFGNSDYDETIGCQGCYWFDVKKFHSSLYLNTSN